MNIKMKGTATLALFGFLLASVWAQSHWLDEIIDAADSTASLSLYTECLLDRSTCTPKGQQIKDKLPGYITSYCRGCSADERKKICKLLMILRSKRVEFWEEMLEKYDPRRIHRKNLQRFDQICRAILRTRPRVSDQDSVENEAPPKMQEN